MDTYDESVKFLGQMFMVGFRGQTIDEHHWLHRDIAERNLGGVLLFDRNIDRSVQNFDSMESLQHLTGKLQEISDSLLFIAVDQEGGAVCRLKKCDGFPEICGAADMAAGGSEVTQRHAAKIAETLSAGGINLNFAPVVDMAINKENPIIAKFGRSFGPDADTVVTMSKIFINEHHQCGIGCCLKHFPGHGSAGQDSHKGFVDVTHCWKQEELIPFQRLIEHGFCDGVMTAHLVHTGLEPAGIPATLSWAVLTGLLRERLGFTGVIFSDDLQMRAITNGWTYREAVQKAVLAGVDVLVVGNNLGFQDNALKEGVNAVLELIDNGKIDEHRVQQSIQKIRQFKERIKGALPWNSSQPTA
ncbi:glycoside hydrolase family 3 protein [Desulfogranum japonicum]|uniref:glycoside hydrolase family 3 protein n=1 Tax=Desulfogranum japonicum TaxID=231447 RepID=UPI000427AE0A|nr:glycoside hydrolase family 3 N-terminal domain-containing protein [Desulfogranum japonicum]